MKLKNCPFCGSEALMTYGEVFCPNKNCIIGTMIFSKTTWNTRPAEDELLEVLKELVKPEFHIEEFAEAREKAEQLIEKYEVEK